jgi:hypothetical protein
MPGMPAMGMLQTPQAHGQALHRKLFCPVQTINTGTGSDYQLPQVFKNRCLGTSIPD